MSAAVSCGGTSNDFFESTGARSGGTGPAAGSGGAGGTSVQARGGTAGSGGGSSHGEGGSAATAPGGSAGSNDAGSAGDEGGGEGGAPAPASGGAPPDGHGGFSHGGDGNAGVGGETNAGGVNTNDAGHGGHTSGDGGRADGVGGDGGRADGAGGEVAASGHGGDGGGSQGGRDGSGGVAAGGGLPGVSGAAGEGASAGGESGWGGQSSVCDDTERCDGLDNDCDAGVDEGGVCPESCRGFDLDGRAYMFCTDAGGRFASAELCEEAAMGLVRIDSAGENAGVLAAVQRLGANAPPGSVHIGATDFGWRNEGNFRWPDGTVFWIGTASGSAVNGAYTHWDEGEPNNYETSEDCVEMLVAALAEKAGLWNDVRCSTALSFVCEE